LGQKRGHTEFTTRLFVVSLLIAVSTRRRDAGRSPESMVHCQTAADARPRVAAGADKPKTCTARSVVDLWSNGPSKPKPLLDGRFEFGDGIWGRLLLQHAMASVGDQTAPRPVICAWLNCMSFGSSGPGARRGAAPREGPGDWFSRRRHRLGVECLQDRRLLSAITEFPLAKAVSYPGDLTVVH
jgi:hypothetical protein